MFPCSFILPSPFSLVTVRGCLTSDCSVAGWWSLGAYGNGTLESGVAWVTILMTHRWVFLEYWAIRSLQYSVYLLSILGAQILLKSDQCYGLLFPEKYTYNCAFISEGAGQWRVVVHGSQFNNADYARQFPHSGMLGCWAVRNSDSQPNIVSFRYKYDRNAPCTSYRDMFALVHPPDGHDKTQTF